MQRLPLLVLAFALVGCPGPGAAPTPSVPADPTAAPASDAPPTPGAPPPPAPTPAPPVREPYTLQERPDGDVLTFLGWSDDGRRYAFQTEQLPRGASCSRRFEVYVVDAATDSYPEGGTLTIAHESPEGGDDGCVPKELGPVLTQRRGELLAAQGIRLGAASAPGPAKLAESGLYEAKLPGEAPLRFSFLVRDAAQDIYGPEAALGASYVLTLHPEKGEPVVVESGRRRRPYVVNYSVEGAPVFVGPDGRHAALFVRREHTAFEGTRLSYMSNGVALGAGE